MNVGRRKFYSLTPLLDCLIGYPRQLHTDTTYYSPSYGKEVQKAREWTHTELTIRNIVTLMISGGNNFLLNEERTTVSQNKNTLYSSHTKFFKSLQNLWG
jgi:hypothetical protein